jgi:hypothetical protein
MLNSRRAFRAQSQLLSATRCAGKAYVKRHQDQAEGDIPWHLLQSAYGRIMVPIPEGHQARSRAARLEAGEATDTIYVGIEDLDTGTYGSKFVVSFSATPAEMDNLPSVVGLPNDIWHLVRFPPDKPLRWLGPPADSIEALAVQASRLSIESSKEYDIQLGIPADRDGRRHVALDLRVDRLSRWPHNPDEPLRVYRYGDLLEPSSGSHVYQLLIASAETAGFFCRVVIHIVRIGPRAEANRQWGTITAHGVATKPQQVPHFFFYPPIDFVP